MANKLEVVITGDTRGLRKAFGDAEGRAGSFQAKMSNVSSGISGAFGKMFKGIAIGAAGLGVVGVAGLTATIDEASNLAEAMSKVDQVFGTSAYAVQAWARGASDAFGQSTQQALEAAGTYGNLFQAFGVGQGDAQQMSQTLVELAADLASFNNTSIDDALQALQSGISGETEPLKRYGVALNDLRLREQALAMGLKVGTGPLDARTKALASYALIMKDTKLAQGDFARTSDGLANKQRILAAKFEDMKAKIGTGLLPIILKLAEVGERVLLPVFEELSGGVRAFFMAFSDPSEGVTSSGLAGIIESLGISARKVFDGYLLPVFNEVRGGIRAFIAAWKDGSDEVTSSGLAGWIESLGMHFRNAFDVIQRNWPTISAGVAAGAAAIATGFGKIYSFLQPIVRGFAEFVRNNPKPVFAALAVVIGSVLVGALWSMAAAMTAAFAPVYLIVGAIALLAAGLVYAYQNVDWFRNAVDAMARFVVEKVVPALQAMWHWFQDNLWPIIQTVSAYLIDKTQAAIAAVVDVVQRLVEKSMVLYDWFANKVLPILKTVAEWMADTFVKNLRTARDGIGWVVDKAKTLWEWLDKIVGVARDAGDALSNIPGAGLIGKAGSALGLGGNAQGGHASGLFLRDWNESGREALRIPGGATVVPVGPTRNAMAAGGGVTVIEVPLMLDGREIARASVDVNNRTARMTGRSPNNVTRSALVP